MSAPQPRFRTYGGWSKYGTLLRTLADGLPGDPTTTEAALTARFGTRHAVMAPMARTALASVFRHLVRPGRELVLSPYTIVDVVQSVRLAGAVPRFVDIDPHTGNLDPDALRAFLRGRHRADAVLVTHLHGVSADLPAIARLCSEAGLPLIEDAAQCAGAARDGRAIGTWGIAGVLSFGALKNLNAWFGGAVLTNDDALANAVRADLQIGRAMPRRHLVRKAMTCLGNDLLGAPFVFPYGVRQLFAWGERWQIRPIQRLATIELDRRYHATRPAYQQGRMTAGQLDLLRRQLPDLTKQADARIRLAHRYHAGLSDLPVLRLPPPPDGLANVYTAFCVAVPRRAGAVRWLAAHGLDVAPQHLHCVSALPDFAGPDRCPEAERFAAEALLLPTWPGYRNDQADRVIVALRGWVEAGCPD